MKELIIDSKVIGQRLRSLRGEKTIDQVANDIGIKRSTLNMYELGERIPRDTKKIQLAQYYGVTVEDLFFSND